MQTSDLAKQTAFTIETSYAVPGTSRREAIAELVQVAISSAKRDSLSVLLEMVKADVSELRKSYPNDPAVKEYELGKLHAFEYVRDVLEQLEAECSAT